MYNEIGVLGIDMSALGTLQYWGLTFLVGLIAYLIGNISPATMIAKAKGIDIRKEGSGNPGTTNVLRVMGKKAAVIVLLVDVFKGVIPVVLAGVLLGSSISGLAAIMVFFGHVFPATAGGKGGKGVATAFGALTAIHPGLGFGCLGIVIVVVAISKRMSLGSIIGAAACPVLAWFLAPHFVPEALMMAVVVIWRHKENIKRLAAGEEPKLSFKK